MKPTVRHGDGKKNDRGIGSPGTTLSIVLICLAGIIFYSNTLNSTFHFDDGPSIVDNKSIRDLGDIRSLWGRNPTRIFSYLTFAFNYHFNGLDVVGYHVVNIGIHILSGIALWWLVNLLFSTPVLKARPASQYKNIFSLLAALLFIVHPVQTQAITYIVQRIASLAALLYLVSLSCYIRARLEKKSRRIQIVLVALSFCVGILAMLSKETAYTLPLAIVLFELFFMREKSGVRRFIILFGSGVSVVVPLLFYYMGKMPMTETTGISRAEYLMTQFTVIPVYMRLTVLPVHQTLDYNIAMVKTMSDPWALTGLGVILSVLAAGVLLYRRNRLISFGIFWFFMTLMVESSIIPISDFMFEHRLYLPMAGFCFVFLGVIEEAQKVFSPRTLRNIVGGIILFLGISTFIRNEVWKDEITLWNDCVIKAPDKPREYMNRGMAYQKAGLLTEAMRDYETVIRLKPDDWQAWSNIGAIFDTRQEEDKAIATYTRAIEVAKGKGTDVFFSRSTAYTKKGIYTEALHDLDAFIRERTDVAQAYYNRGCLRRQLGNTQGAITDFVRAIELDSSQGDYFFDRGVLYQQTGQSDKALSDYDKAIERSSHSRDSYINKAFIMAQRGACKEASENYTQALLYEPNSVHILNDRGMVRYQCGEFENALLDLTTAIQNDSLTSLLYQNRSLIYKALGQNAKAEEDLKTAKLLSTKVRGNVRSRPGEKGN